MHMKARLRPMHLCNLVEPVFVGERALSVAGYRVEASGKAGSNGTGVAVGVRVDVGVTWRRGGNRLCALKNQNTCRCNSLVVSREYNPRTIYAFIPYWP